MADRSFQQFLDYLDRMEGQYGAPNEWYMESTPYQQGQNTGVVPPNHIRQGYQPPRAAYQPATNFPMEAGSFIAEEGRPHYPRENQPGANQESYDRVVAPQTPIRQGYQPPRAAYQPLTSVPMRSFNAGEGRPNYQRENHTPGFNQTAVGSRPVGNSNTGSGGKNIKPPTYDG